MAEDRLTHLDEAGAARMVDVSVKAPTVRTAVAESFVVLPEHVRRMVFEGGLPKGDAVAVVRVAAIQAAKQTPHLVPLCHPIALTGIEVAVEEVPDGARIEVRARAADVTGVEMEAMTAAAIGAVTLYDMVKSVEKGIELGPVRLVEKTGGKSGDWHR